MQNHQKPDKSYTYYVTDGSGKEIPVIIELGKLADELAEMDRAERNQDAYWRQNRDVLFDVKRRRAADTNEDMCGDPLDAIPDMGASVHELAFGEDTPERIEIVIVRKVIAALPASKKKLYEKCYIREIPQADIAREEGVSRPAVCKRHRRLLDEVRCRLSDAGIDDSFFESRKP